MILLIILLLSCYLLGAIPFSVVVGKLFFGRDVRKEGSGNPGATNTMRVLGKKAGFAVLFLDMGKGAIAVLFASQLYSSVNGSIKNLTPKELEAICGGLAILGHVYSPFLKFKGGEGVATSIGTVLALNPAIGLIMMLAFLVVLVLSKYVSLGSIIAAALYPVLTLLFDGNSSRILLTFSILLALMIIIKHKDNIKRLLSGNENTFSLKSKKTA